MDTRELLAAIAKKHALRSNYAVAKYLGISQQRMSGYANGHKTIGDELAVQIADDLGLDVGFVLASIAAERATHVTIKAAWARAARKLAGVVAAALGVYIALPLVDFTGSDMAFAASGSVYYVKSILALWLAFELLSLAAAIEPKAYQDSRRTAVD